MNASKITTGGIVKKFLGRLRFPQLFLVAASLFVLDTLWPDPIPLLDEIFLGVLTLLVSQWRQPEAPQPDVGASEKPPAKDVTPR